MSVNQLYQPEKKIRCISLLKQDALHQITNLTFGDIPSHPVSDNSSEGIRLHEFLSGSTIDDMTNSDTSVTYYVCGYAGCSISRRRKCSSCKNLLVDSDELVSVVSLYILVTVPIKELPFSLALYLRAGFYFGFSFHSSNRLCNS